MPVRNYKTSGGGIDWRGAIDRRKIKRIYGIEPSGKGLGESSTLSVSFQ
jgi:hypothetical protein